jgi:hypothetical protein
MTLQDYSLTVFTVLNGARIVAYVPQIVCVCRDRSGTTSVSMTTWGIFFAANVATVFYALAGTGDHLVAGIFALNAVACMFIVSLILKNRFQHAYRDHLRTTLRQSFASRLSAITAPLLMSLRGRLEDQLAALHPSDRWSDATERSIHEHWCNRHCGIRSN